MTPELREDLNRWMAEFLRQEEAADRFSGAVAIAHGAEVAFEAAYGMQHQGFRVPNRMDTRFNLASITKMFTAVAVMQLWERGKLALDDTVDKYLPKLRVGGSDRMTVNHLLCHASGLGMYWNEKCKQRRSTLRTISAYLELLEGEVPAFEPGNAAQYGNSGYLVLGGVVEAAADMDYYDYIQDHICKRVDMPRTAHLHLDRVADFAHGYTYNEWEGPAHPEYRTDNIFQYPVRGNPAVALYSTAPEMLRFGAALRHNQLLRAETHELMLQAHARDANGQAFGYGYQYIPYSQGTAVGHGGRLLGGATIFLTLPAVDMTVCILSNYDRPADKRVFAHLDQWLVRSKQSLTTDSS
jgi:D-alanyl-D-alanine carboxypeptidase